MWYEKALTWPQADQISQEINLVTVRDDLIFIELLLFCVLIQAMEELAITGELFTLYDSLSKLNLVTGTFNW